MIVFNLLARSHINLISLFGLDKSIQPCFPNIARLNPSWNHMAYIVFIHNDSVANSCNTQCHSTNPFVAKIHMIQKDKKIFHVYPIVHLADIYL